MSEESKATLADLLSAYDWQPIIGSLIEPIAAIASDLVPAIVTEESVIAGLDEDEAKAARAYVSARIALAKAETALVKSAGATLPELVEAATNLAVAATSKATAKVASEVGMLAQLAKLPSVPDDERAGLESVLSALTKPAPAKASVSKLGEAKADREWLRVNYPADFGPNGKTPLADAGKLPALAKAYLAQRDA